MATIRCRRLAALFLAALLLAPAAALEAQDQILPRTLYRRAQSALAAGDYATALTDFSDYVARYPASPVHGGALLGAARAALFTGDQEAALRFSDEYLRAPAAREGQAIAQLYRGHAFLATGDVSAAVSAYSDGYSATRRNEIRFAFGAVLKGLAGALPLDDARGLLELEMPSELSSAVWFDVANRFEQAGQRYQAAQLFRELAERNPRTDVGVAARLHQRELELALVNTMRVAFLAPLSGPLAEYGEDLKRGVELAAQSFSDSTGREVVLLVEDTEGNAVAATRACQNVVTQDPVAVIGPLTSSSAIGCAATTAQRNIPLVVPAATETGLPTLGDAVVCLSPSVTTYGRALGTYAVEGLQLCSHLIIAPNDAFGYEAAAEYRRAVEAAGGEIWYEAYYEPGITDFGPYLRAFKASFLDTLSDTTWFYAPDSTSLDYEEVTVYPDAVFTPGYADDLILLLPQIKFYKIAGRILGTDSFADDELLMRVGGNLEGAVFASVRPLADGIMEGEAFKSAFARKFGENPQRLSALGYDAFRLLAGGLGDSVVTPGSVGRYLRTISEFQGTHGLMRFNRRGENTGVPIYYIRNRRIAQALR